MRGIVQPALHGKHIDAIRAEHDMVDFLQAANVSGNGQRDREVALLVLAPEGAMRKCPDAMQHLCVKRMRRMRRFGQQRRVMRIDQRCQCVLPGDTIHMQSMCVLEGSDCVFGVGAESAVDGDGMAVGVAVAEVVQLLL